MKPTPPKSLKLARLPINSPVKSQLYSKSSDFSQKVLKKSISTIQLQKLSNIKSPKIALNKMFNLLKQD